MTIIDLLIIVGNAYWFGHHINLFFWYHESSELITAIIWGLLMFVHIRRLD
jgi:hypothetical protein